MGESPGITPDETAAADFFRPSKRALLFFKFALLSGHMEFRGKPISRNEVIRYAVYFLISAMFSFLAVFLFDMQLFFHPSGEFTLPTRMFDSPLPYAVGVLAGGLVGLVTMKVLFWAFMEED